MLITIHRFSRVSSTNQTLWELLDQGAPTGTVVIGAEQTAGRGQWGRQWESGLGGLYLSLALKPNWPAMNSADLTIATAWGIATTLRHQQIPLQLKPPNDLFLEGKKLGGILTETRIHQGIIISAVVGVGINWENSVPSVGINLESYWQQANILPQISTLETLEKLTLEGISLGYDQLIAKGLDSLFADYEKLLIRH